MLPALRASSIERPDSVAWYIETYGDANQTLAKQYAEKSAALENEFSAKAIWNMKRAITLHPEKKYYRQLIALLMQTGQYEEAVRVSSILVRPAYKKDVNGKYSPYYIFDKPHVDDFYNSMISSLASGDTYGFNESIYEAQSLDFDIKEIRSRLEKDPKFTLKPGTSEYDDYSLSFLSEGEIDTYCNDPRNFEKFIAKISTLQEPVSFSEREVTKFNYDAFNGRGSNSMDGISMTTVESYFLPERKTDPDNWIQYNMRGKKQLNEHVWIILYAVDTSAIACPREMRGIYINMMTYTSKGDYIDSKVIAWQAPYSAATVFLRGNEASITEYKRQWRKPFEKYDFDNDLVLTEPIGSKEYIINAEGKIMVKEPSPIN